ncbi:hypothetical protein [Roseateles sp. YR242]|uniref:hypothetical protein n=1 Tax=Roseateles sp. YR242 TaxID=1855305 RepID=UPI00116012B2|nr:hypothetical protein [Roseateles sp. YR242]
MSSGLFALANQLDEAVKTRTSTFQQLLGRRDPFSRAIRTSSGTAPARSARAPRRLSITGNELVQRIQSHRGPIIFLDVHGSPQVLFERCGDQWQGYLGVTRQPCDLTLLQAIEKSLQQPGAFFEVAYIPFGSSASPNRKSNASQVDDVLIIRQAEPARERKRAQEAPAREPGVVPPHVRPHESAQGQGGEVDDTSSIHTVTTFHSAADNGVEAEGSTPSRSALPNEHRRTIP